MNIIKMWRTLAEVEKRKEVKTKQKTKFDRYY